MKTVCAAFMLVQNRCGQPVWDESVGRRELLFYDEDYRRRKHEAALANLIADDERRKEWLQPHELEREAIQEPLKEAKRQAWFHEREGNRGHARTARRKAEQLESKF